MVQDISELKADGYPQPFLPLEVLGNCAIQIPARKASNVSGTTTIVVDPQDTWPKLRENRRRIAEHVQARRVARAYAVGAGNAVMK